MQKKIIALAVAGLMSGAAFAQSNVTVYGIVDVGYTSGSANAATKDKFSGLTSGNLSGSRIGFRGAEDLGGGLKANFTVELGTMDTTANNTTNTATQSTTTNGIDTYRQAFVGLSGGFGGIVAGRLQHQGFWFGAKYDAHGASIFSPVGQLTQNLNTAISGRSTLARLDNAVQYSSPNFGGLVVNAAYAFGEQVEGATAINATGATTVDYAKQQKAWMLNAEYDAGPMSAGLIYAKLSDIGGTLVGAVDGTDQTEWALGAKYNFGMITPFFSYQRAKNDPAGATAETTSKIWNVGARANVTAAGSVGLAYARMNQSGVGDDKARAWGLDYQHAMSKRTTAYAGIANMKNANGSAFEFKGLTGSAFGQAVAADGNQKSSVFSLGMRHTF